MVLIEGWFSKIASYGFRGSCGFLDLHYFDKGFSKSHLVVIVVSVVLVVSIAKHEQPPS